MTLVKILSSEFALQQKTQLFHEMHLPNEQE